MATVAQNSAKRTQVLQVSSGGFISFKSETSALDSSHNVESRSVASLIYTQALTGENRIIHRVISDSQRRVIFGYDLWVSSDPIMRKFSLAVMPVDEDFRRTFMKETASKRVEDSFATFPRSTKPQTLDDGDAVSLELLVNHESGMKIVDVVRVTFDSSRLLERSPESPPKDFTLDAIAMSVKEYQLMLDGNRIAKGRSTFACTGSLLWFYVPDRGRFILSLVPREDYPFHKIGILDGNRIEFFIDGQHYEWISSAPILPTGGVWNIWVLQDPKYTPLFGPQKSIASDKSPGVLERLNNTVQMRGGNNSLTVTSQWPKPPNKNANPQSDFPSRVMVGGAESMAHLLPRSP